jgi:hypothetical protein
MLSATDIAAMDSALQHAREGAETARALVPGLLDRWWSSAIGADSTAAAIESNALAAESLVRELEGRFSRLSQDPAAGPAERDDFVRACGVATQNTAAADAAAQLEPSTAVVQVAAGTAADLAAGVKWTAIIGTPVLLVLGLALVLWHWPWKER